MLGTAHGSVSGGSVYCDSPPQAGGRERDTFLKQFSESSYLSLALELEGLACPVVQRTGPYSVLGLGQILNCDSSLLSSLGSRWSMLTAWWHIPIILGGCMILRRLRCQSSEFEASLDYFIES